MRLLALSILLMTNVLLNAQITFSKTFCDSIEPWRKSPMLSRGPIVLNNGYLFVFAGSNLSLSQGSFITVLKTNFSGEEIWRNEQQNFNYRYSIGSIFLDSDSSIYISYLNDTLTENGRRGKLNVDKYTINGENIWRKKFWGNEISYSALPYEIKVYNDLVYISMSSHNTLNETPNGAYYNISLVCINKDGDFNWIKTYDSGGNEDFNFSFLKGSDSSFYISGLTNGLGANGLRGHLIKTDVEGNLIWQKLYNDIAGIMTINTFENVNFILTGINPSQPNTNGRIIEINNNGERINTHHFTFEESLDFYRSSQISDGNIVTVGLSNINPNAHNCGIIQKSTSNGETLWRHRHSYNEFNSYFIDFKETDDSGFIIIGSAREVETGQDAWLLKLDSNGCLEPGCLEVGIEETELEIGITIYPNPTQDRLFIKTETSQKKPLKFSLYNLQGKLIIQESLVAEYESFDLSNLSTGVYLVHIIDNNGKKVSRKIIKN